MHWTSTEKSTAAESELWLVKAVIAFARQRPFALQARWNVSPQGRGQPVRPERPLSASQLAGQFPVLNISGALDHPCWPRRSRLHAQTLSQALHSVPTRLSQASGAAGKGSNLSLSGRWSVGARAVCAFAEVLGIQLWNNLPVPLKQGPFVILPDGQAATRPLVLQRRWLCMRARDLSAPLECPPSSDGPLNVQ